VLQGIAAPGHNPGCSPGSRSRCWRWPARAGLGAGFTFGGEVGLDLFGNLRGQAVPPDTRLPNGRAAIGQYLEATRTPLISLTSERICTVDRDLFARVTAGYLEMMYGGVRGELLWRPFDRSFAVGADLAWVRQRECDQGFGSTR
jgi:hypothetical protein